MSLKSFKSNEITYVMGDFNAKIGKGRRSDLVGKYDLRESNERGDRLFDFSPRTQYGSNIYML